MIKEHSKEGNQECKMGNEIAVADKIEGNLK